VSVRELSIKCLPFLATVDGQDRFGQGLLNPVSHARGGLFACTLSVSNKLTVER